MIKTKPNMEFYQCPLNLESFIHVLDDVTECYKFYWFDSIMQLIAADEQIITFEKVISGMIADAWYSVTEYHLKMGAKDVDGNTSNSIERAVEKIAKLELLDADSDRRKVLSVVHNNRALLHPEMEQLSKNAPFRLLSPFINIGGNDPLWDKKGELIKYINQINGEKPLLYTIGDERGLNKRVIIDDNWMLYLKDNMVPIRGWIQNKKVEYLQARNPNVPGIINKMRPEDIGRKLPCVRALWAGIIDLMPVVDIYSGTDLCKNDDYEIDHFVPWSYVTNDEMWNLMPVNGDLNSSKRNRLPNWDKYFALFAHNQYILNSLVYQYSGIKRLFENCRRDNLNELWSIKELYIEGIKEEEFVNRLSLKMKPIYDSAFMLGYAIWNH